MKKYLLIISIALAVSCTQENELSSDLLGRWDMKDVIIFGTDRTDDLNPAMDRWIEFNGDGSFISGGSLGRNTGKYTLVDNELALDSDAGEGDDSQWNIEIRNDSLFMTGLGTDRQESSIISNVRSKTGIPSISITPFEAPSSVRAIEIDDQGQLWLAGADGKWGYSQKSNDWTFNTIEYEGNAPHFRALEVTQRAVFILSIESPALLYRNEFKGIDWQLVYKEEGEGVFYDAMEFWDRDNGIAVGDSMDGCLSIIITNDGGLTWRKLSCEDLPPALDGEGCFAASDSNIKTLGSNAWIVTTGGRVYHSPDMGMTWEVFNTPIDSEESTAGIFSVDFYDENNGIIMGGNFSKPELNEANVATTNDGGKTWNLTAINQDPDYRSCVRYVPGKDGKEIWAVGFQGLSWSGDAGKSWKKISNADYYSLRLDENGMTGWLSGNQKIARIEVDY